MTNIWHPSALQGFPGADTDLDGADTLTVQAYTNAVTQAAFVAASFLDDLDAGEALGDPIPMTGVVFSTTGLVSVDPFTLTSVGLGDVIGALVYYLDTGSAATSPLVGFQDKRADGSTLAFTGTGNPLTVNEPSGLGTV